MEDILGTPAAFVAPFISSATAVFPYLIAVAGGVLTLALGKKVIVKAYSWALNAVGR